MKNRNLFLLLFSFLLICISFDADAQRSKRKKKKPADKYFDESGGSLKSRLWYGGSINFALANQAFLIGAQPIIGYKITPKFSVGPYLGYNFQTIRSREQDFKLNTNIYQFGAVSRMKFTQAFFAHGEFVRAIVAGKETNNGVTTKESFGMTTPRLGLGYNSSTGLFGFELLALYEFDPLGGTEGIPETFLRDIPVLVRFGINYNF